MVLCRVGRVVTMAVAVVAPAGTRTFAGGATSEGFELVKATVAPPAGAGALSVTVAMNGVPPTTLEWSSVSVASEGAGAGVTVNTAVLLLAL